MIGMTPAFTMYEGRYCVSAEASEAQKKLLT
jgi:hypothetical protein